MKYPKTNFNSIALFFDPILQQAELGMQSQIQFGSTIDSHAYDLEQGLATTAI